MALISWCVLWSIFAHRFEMGADCGAGWKAGWADIGWWCLVLGTRSAMLTVCLSPLFPPICLGFYYCLFFFIALWALILFFSPVKFEFGKIVKMIRFSTTYLLAVITPFSVIPGVAFSLSLIRFCAMFDIDAERISIYFYGASFLFSRFFFIS